MQWGRHENMQTSTKQIQFKFFFSRNSGEALYIRKRDYIRKVQTVHWTAADQWTTANQQIREAVFKKLNC